MSWRVGLGDRRLRLSSDVKGGQSSKRSQKATDVT